MRHNRAPIFYEIFAAYGNATKAALAIGVTKQAVSAWNKVPLKHTYKIMSDTGIPLHRIRPDIFR